MGYTTEFIGSFTVQPILRPEHAEYLRLFSQTRRMKRDSEKANNLPDPARVRAGLPVGAEGAYFVGGTGYFGQGNDVSIQDYNKPPAGQPHLWCFWAPNIDGSAIEWTGHEKFSRYIEWLKYLLFNFLIPWGYNLDGVVHWAGEDDDDKGTIHVRSNIVTTERL